MRVLRREAAMRLLTTICGLAALVALPLSPAGGQEAAPTAPAARPTEAFLVSCALMGTGEPALGTAVLALPGVATYLPIPVVIEEEDGDSIMVAERLQIPVPGAGGEQVRIGERVRIQVDPLPGEQVRVDIQYDRATPESSGDENFRVAGAHVRTVETTALGESLKVVWAKDTRGQESRWGEFIVGRATALPEDLFEKRYSVFDLVVPVSTGEEIKADFQPLIKRIESSVAAESWETAGGDGLIEIDRPALTLVVTQTLPVHAELTKLLNSLRTAQQVVAP